MTVIPITEARTLKFQKELINEGIEDNLKLLRVLEGQLDVEDNEKKRKLLSELITLVLKSFFDFQRDLKKLEERGGG